MTLFLLVRHAAHDHGDGILVGRSDGVRLSDAGRLQATALRDRLRPLQIDRVQSSPRERAAETALIIAGTRQVETVRALDELDYGLWTGSTFDELDRDYRWRRWNSARHETRPPWGESMREAQMRIVSHLRHLHETFPDRCIVLVTHAEMIRAAILHVMDMPLDQWSRIEVPLASITRLQMRSRTHGIVSLGGGLVVA